MTNKKDYTLIGVGAGIEFAIGGGQFVWNADHFESTSDGSTLAPLRVPTIPVDVNDAVSKSYADSISAGLDAKNAVRFASTTALTLATNFENGKVIDGGVLVTGDRILIKDQAAGLENGIYTVNAFGTPTRATDADTTGEITGGTFVFVEEGTTQADTGWVVTTNGAILIGTTAITWGQFNAVGGSITAGTGLTKAVTAMNLNVGAATIGVNGTDDVIVNSSAMVNQTLLSTGTVGVEATWGALPLNATNAVSGLLGMTNGGLNNDISGFANSSLLIMNNTGSIVTELVIGTNGNSLIISGGAPVWSTINLADNTNSVTGILDETNGGTGNSAYVVGDLIIGTGVNTLGKITISATAGRVLASNGTTAVWSTINLADNVGAVTGILDETNGGTGNSAYAVGDLIIGTGANTLGKITISATPNEVLTSDGTTASWAAPNVGTVTGILGMANGGLNTNISGFADASLLIMNNTGSNVTELAIGTNGNSLIASGGAPVWSTINLADNVNSVTGILDETNGGTGNSVYVVGDLVIGTGVNTLGKITISATPNEVLTSDGTTAVWAAPNVNSVTGILDETKGGTGNSTYVVGDLIIGAGANTLGKITISATPNEVLTSDGTTASWTAPTPASGTVVAMVAAITEGGGSTQAIGTVPAGGRVIKVSVDVDAAWNATDTVVIGDSGLTDRLMTATENDPEIVAIYSSDTNHLYATITVVNATVPTTVSTTGSATVIISYIQP
jgi:hypothetical protein